jgi:hypothetical protein
MKDFPAGAPAALPPAVRNIMLQREISPRVDP